MVAEKRSYRHLQGVDLSLDISLLEYGLAWFDDPESDEIEFFYGVRGEEDGNFSVFDNASISRSVDPREEWSFAEWSEIASFCGMTEQKLLEQPLERIVHDLLAYYGYMNVFGPLYWRGWNWNSNIQRFQLEKD